MQPKLEESSEIGEPLESFVAFSQIRYIRN